VTRSRLRWVVVLTVAGVPHSALGAFYTPDRAQKAGERLWRRAPELSAAGFGFAVVELSGPRGLV
jgi:hypothetical protein